MPPNIYKSLNALDDNVPLVSTFAEEEKSAIFTKFILSELNVGKVLDFGGFCKVSEITGIDLDLNNDENKEECHHKSILQTFEPSIHDEYVIKQLRGDLEPSLRILGNEDLLKEAKYLETLSHPNIIGMRGTAFEQKKVGDFFIILEKIDHTLERQIENWEERDKCISSSWWKRSRNKQITEDLWVERVDAAYGISSALNYLHEQNIIYRDLKPQNIGFDEQGNVKLFDFGLSKKLDRKNRDGPNHFLLTGFTGSLRYMAPEVWGDEDRRYNLSADAYSFGILFWYICSLKVPFPNYTIDMMHSHVVVGQNRPKIDKSWLKECNELMQKCWDNDPLLRPSFLHIRNALGKVQNTQINMRTGHITVWGKNQKAYETKWVQSAENFFFN
eukprot:CAMPEP_0194270990 /NCGR_PEP_ID=MMETSP0169-20130528/4885_1 /TAXON_ID=218684 /ORGANISM="Corethron pennatum, Strain L29A3" /LENGTH=386 /DNA_ID=CAMNT_0039013235 /DNA_START=65 /DNA_END=1225 /DNA_ORIENTATION=+